MDEKRVAKIDNVRLLVRGACRREVNGALHLSERVLKFVDHERTMQITIYTSMIAEAKKEPLTPSGSPLRIRCKNFCDYVFYMSGERYSDDAIRQIAKDTTIESPHDLYAFYWQPRKEDLFEGRSVAMNQRIGWNFHNLEADFGRMNLHMYGRLWRHDDVNAKYQLCDTYPSVLYVPATATKQMLHGSANFRSRSRIPVLTYLHKTDSDHGEFYPAICRSSQPSSMFTAPQNEDVQLVESIYKANPGPNNFIYVIDTRPSASATANALSLRGGWERESNYSCIKYYSAPIENIHAMRGSLTKLLDGVSRERSQGRTISSLNPAAAQWLEHVRAVLEVSWFTVKAVINGTSCLVHCSDGWDRTSKVCALAQLMLDPYYRTLTGFQALIEKDFLAFGHKFMDRCGHLANANPDQVSPVFLIFVDGVWQLLRAFPKAFQFNARLLMLLHDQSQSCMFGTFLGNCEKDRLDLGVRERTHSIWGSVLNRTEDYCNTAYDQRAFPGPLIPPISNNKLTINVDIWTEMYQRADEIEMLAAPSLPAVPRQLSIGDHPLPDGRLLQSTTGCHIQREAHSVADFRSFTQQLPPARPPSAYNVPHRQAAAAAGSVDGVGTGGRTQQPPVNANVSAAGTDTRPPSSSRSLQQFPANAKVSGSDSYERRSRQLEKIPSESVDDDRRMSMAALLADHVESESGFGDESLRSTPKSAISSMQNSVVHFSAASDTTTTPDA